MNYSFVPSGVYSVPDVRLTRQGFYGERPTTLIRPGLPITPINMLPYQGKKKCYVVATLEVAFI